MRCPVDEHEYPILPEGADSALCLVEYLRLKREIRLAHRGSDEIMAMVQPPETLGDQLVS